MLQELSGPPANPSSTHLLGRRAKQLLFDARKSVSTALKVDPRDLFFTSGATEAINYLLHGLQGHIISTRIEHSSIFETLEKRKKEGLLVSYAPVGLQGAPLKKTIESLIVPETTAMILSLANSETGVKIDFEDMADLAFRKGIPLLLDAVSFLGKEPIPSHPGLGALAVSAHKMHGPKGVGALYLHPSLKIPSQMIGGSQEGQKRAGTENLAGIVGFAKACDLFLQDQTAITKTLLSLRTAFEERILSEIPEVFINGEKERICNTSNLSFSGVDGETLLIQLDLAGIAVSHGSACASNSLEPSRTLLEMGIEKQRARSSVRFSFSKMNTLEEVHYTVDVLSEMISSLRGCLQS